MNLDCYTGSTHFIEAMPSVLNAYRDELNQNECGSHNHPAALKQSGYSVKTIDAFVSLARRDPDLKQTDLLKQALEIRALARLREGEPHLAVLDGRRLLKLDRTSPHTHKLLALSYFELANRYNTVSQALKRDDESQKLSEELMPARKFVKKEMKEFQKWPSHRSSPFKTMEIFLDWVPRKEVGDEVYAEVLKGRGKMFLQMGLADEAFKDLKLAERLSPSSAGVSAQLSKVYKALSQGHTQAQTGRNDLPYWVYKV